MGKFCRINTELWPLTYIKISFPAYILGIYRPIFFKLCIGVQIRKDCFGIEDGKISSNKYRVTALDLRLNFIFGLLSGAFIDQISSNFV